MENFPLNVRGVEWWHVNIIVLEVAWVEEFHDFRIELANEGDVEVGESELGDLISKEEGLDFGAWDDDMENFNGLHVVFAE